MAKGGRPPSGEYSGKAKVLSTRITAELRTALENAAKKNGRSLSQEIENRLQWSFSDDAKIESAFGSKRNYVLMRMAALAIEANKPEIVRRGGQANDWLTDADLFEQTLQTIISVLEGVRPSGETTAQWDRDSKILAATIWSFVQKADPSISVFEGTRFEQTLAWLKRELGDLTDRPKVAEKDYQILWQEDLDNESIAHFFRWTAVGRQLPKDRQQAADYLIKKYPKAWEMAVDAGPLGLEASPTKPKRKTK